MSFSSIRFEARHGKGGPGGNVRVSFLATSWETPRSSINAGTARREAVRASVGEVVENLATPPPQLCTLARHTHRLEKVVRNTVKSPSKNQYFVLSVA